MEDILAAFTTAFRDTLRDPELYDRIQKVKDALYRRSYLEAFGSPQNLEAYIVRWSPSRALAYASILGKYDATRDLLSKHCNSLCIGGGAGAEIVALSHLGAKEVLAMDVAHWEPVTNQLRPYLNLESLSFKEGDAMQLIKEIDLSRYQLVTCLFTTNELAAQSKRGYVDMLRDLSRLPKGALFVVIESAGSYSEIQIGTKTFPVHYLLHYTLSKGKWELVNSTDSEWYRLPEKIEYPWELQNMRYFLRIYRRT